ncbi:putative glucose-repressible protein Grg1 [Elsinoe fawcettii]|nr:putative glucose-repressible protein Grg1 [Elsinoe fawcettii]
MSVPNADKPNEGIVGQISNSVSNAANYVSETIQGKSAEASKEANKEQAKGNVPGNDSVTDRVSGALGAAGDKVDQHKHDASARANKEGIKLIDHYDTTEGDGVKGTADFYDSELVPASQR